MKLSRHEAFASFIVLTLTVTHARRPKNRNPNSMEGMIEMLSLCEEFQIPNQTVSCEKEWQPRDVTTFQMIVDAYIRGQLKEKDFVTKKLESLVNLYVKMSFNITPAAPGQQQAGAGQMGNQGGGPPGQNQAQQGQNQGGGPPGQNQAPQGQSQSPQGQNQAQQGQNQAQQGQSQAPQGQAPGGQGPGQGQQQF